MYYCSDEISLRLASVALDLHAVTFCIMSNFSNKQVETSRTFILLVFSSERQTKNYVFEIFHNTGAAVGGVNIMWEETVTCDVLLCRHKSESHTLLYCPLWGTL